MSSEGGPIANVLMLIDIQVGFEDPVWGDRNNPRAEDHAQSLLKKWRDEEQPIVHIQHISDKPGSPLSGAGAAFKTIAQPFAGEAIFQKRVNSAFIGTNLDSHLKSIGAIDLTICGLTTPHCISTTTRMAANLGYTVRLVADACAAFTSHASAPFPGRTPIWSHARQSDVRQCADRTVRLQICRKVIVSLIKVTGGSVIPSHEFQKAITIRHLRVIAALSELGLVARVSDALKVTQPAVSKQIAELERIVGVPIVTRDRNRLYLTEVGHRLADHARQALNQIERAAFDIEAMAIGVSGSVSVGVVSSVAPTLLPGAVALFKSSTPQASISIREGHFVELLPDLESGALDVLIARIWQPQELPGIDQQSLFAEPLVVVAGRNHRLAKRPVLEWADLADFPWLVPQANSVARRAVDVLFAENGLTPPANTIASLSLTLNLAMLEALPALGLFPQRLAQSHAARGDIVILPLDTGGLLSEARCFWRSDQTETNHTLSFFLKCLRKVTEDLTTIPFG